MCNGQYCRFVEQFFNLLLDECIRLQIHIRRRLINQQNFALFQYCPGETQQLLFANGQIRATLVELKVESLF